MNSSYFSIDSRGSKTYQHHVPTTFRAVEKQRAQRAQPQSPHVLPAPLAAVLLPGAIQRSALQSWRTTAPVARAYL